MGNDEKPPTGGVRLDKRQVRVLAHPLRMRLLGALRVGGPATATRLAELLDTNTGATSYHLRQLAEVGLVTEDPNRSAGRQRFWRAAHEFTQWETSDYDDDPDARAAIDWIRGSQVRHLAEQAERWLATQEDWSSAWRDALGMSDIFMHLTPARLQALKAELDAVVERHRSEADLADPDAVRVTLFVAAYPLHLEER